MSVSGVRTILAGELTGTLQPEKPSPDAAKVGNTSFEAMDKTAPTSPKRSMLQRVGDFFSGLGKSLSRLLPSFAPSSPSAKFEKLSGQINEKKAALAEIKQDTDQAKKAYTKGMSDIKAMGAELAEKKKALIAKAFRVKPESPNAA